MNYDIIGDIHGHADALKALLNCMGYQLSSGAWRHPDRTAIFVGDFIDRGPHQIETVDIVRRMVEAGSALAVMGNHELNAIAWYLPDPENPGQHLRSHQLGKQGGRNYVQHKAFLSEVIDTPIHKEIIDWFLKLPLWLDLPGLRVVHACWHPSFMDFLSPILDDGHKINADLMVRISRQPDDPNDRDTPEPTIFKAVETLLKGLEIQLPYPQTFKDKDGYIRDRVRVRWWDSDATTYQTAAILNEEVRAMLPVTNIPSHAQIGLDAGKPVFFGHYWMTGVPRILAKNAACVDYSVAKGGKLTAYRWDGEQELRNEAFVSA